MTVVEREPRALPEPDQGDEVSPGREKVPRDARIGRPVSPPFPGSESALVETEVGVREVLHRAADPVRDVLRKAKAECVANWTGREPASPDETCVAISLSRASYGAPDGTFSRACRAIAGEIGVLSYIPDIAAWNDAPGRTKAEVIAAFDRAIMRQAAEAQ